MAGTGSIGLRESVVAGSGLSVPRAIRLGIERHPEIPRGIGKAVPRERAPAQPATSWIACGGDSARRPRGFEAIESDAYRLPASPTMVWKPPQNMRLPSKGILEGSIDALS